MGSVPRVRGGKTKIAGAVFLALLLGPGVLLLAAEVINPHYGKHCNSCHLRDPERTAGNAMDYNFLAEEIDPTCLICHSRECCDLGEKHLTHPSALERWDRKRFGEPRELELQKGYITCVTCHYWRRESKDPARDYKLVRLVKISPTGIDYSQNCQDCHKDF